MKVPVDTGIGSEAFRRNHPKKCSYQDCHYASLRCCRRLQSHIRVPQMQDLSPDGVDAYSEGLKPQQMR